ncbi:FAD-dependent monooxygenase [Streptomyces cellulosae]|uniref:FAD-dependent monooxygenase n=1 Tax=Streptomyces thermocarboxydus TaxID=59299 RepID=A0ABU3JI22_9ACTN|nr:hypothetical protein [Streptomyces sp. McG7]MDT6974682.1 FAD-dependent monooxygenase [Streptomyces thermocarboxydus]
MPPRVVVIGGSLGGLNAALHLYRTGADVEVFERNGHEPRDDGAGVLLPPSTERLLAECGAFPVGVARTVRHFDAQGALLREEPRAHRFASWAALHRALLTALGRDRVRRNHAVVGLEQDGRSAAALFRGGRIERADLVVCADGTGSTSRRLLLPRSFPRYAGYVAWRGRVHESSLPPSAARALAGAVSFLRLPDSHVRVSPAPGHLLDFVWYRDLPDGRALTATLTDRTGTQRSLTVPAGMVPDASVRRMREAAAEMMPPFFAELVSRAPEPYVEQVVDVTVPRMVVGRICLIGDAAFTSRPPATAGAAKAVEDGWSLAAAIGRTGTAVPDALAEWEPARLERGRRLVAGACALGRSAGLWESTAKWPFIV